MTESTRVSPAPLRPLSAELAQLRADLGDQPVTLRAIIAALQGRAYELLMILFALPFVAPVSVPGSSTPLGLAVAVIAAQLAFGRLPWLPRRVLDAQLPPGFFAKVFAATHGVVRFLEKFLRPRGGLLTRSGALMAAHLLAVAFAGLLLALPLPIPFTNTFPGWTILLFAAGLIARDGGFIAAGYAMLVATLVFFALLGASAGGALFTVRGWFAG